MAVRPVDGNELYRIEKLLDTDIVRQDKVALNLLEQVLYDIQHVPTLTPPNEWVSVEERLPEESYGMVLLTNGKVVISGYRNKLFGLDGKHGVFAPEIKRGGGYMQVTYWMPLPAPPDRCPPEGIQ